MSLDIILKPSITEKSFKLAKKSQFTFFVKKSAGKNAIAHAVEELFKVNVIKVRTVKKAGKVKRSGKSKIAKKTSDQKKAIITLKPGQVIEYFKLPEEKTTIKKPTVKLTPKSKSKKKKSLGLGKRKEQRTQGK
ncbi:MAG: 50S ribosomal protein L23 [Patescibacteria group bacterium]|nr:50S ribosomal protein L23 [Patescibacteria group bacterium]